MRSNLAAVFTTVLRPKTSNEGSNRVSPHVDGALQTAQTDIGSHGKLRKQQNRDGFGNSWIIF